METLRLLCRTWLSLACLVLLLWATCRARAFQVSAPAPPTLEKRIAQDMELIEVGERTGLDPQSMGRLWTRLALAYEDAAEFSKSEAAYNHALQLFEHTPNAAKDYAWSLENLGSLYLAMHNDDEAERCRRRAQSALEAIGDKLDVAWGKALLAEVYIGKHKYKEAQQTASEAYDVMVALKSRDSRQLVATLITLTYSSCMHRQCTYAVQRGQEAKSLALAAFPADSLLTGEVRSALGYAEWKAGMRDAADEEMRESIRIMKKQTTPGHPYLLGVMTQYRNYLKDVHRTAEANEIAREEEALTNRPPNACASCTVSVYSLLAH